MTENRNTPFQIGNVTIPGRVIFAPMAGVSDLPFRLLCREQGASLVCMEMISAKAITYRNVRTHGDQSCRSAGLAPAFWL